MLDGQEEGGQHNNIQTPLREAPMEEKQLNQDLERNQDLDGTETNRYGVPKIEHGENRRSGRDLRKKLPPMPSLRPLERPGSKLKMKLPKGAGIDEELNAKVAKKIEDRANGILRRASGCL